MSNKLVARRTVIAGAAALTGVSMLAPRGFAQAAAPKPEMASIKLGLPVAATTFLPIYIGVDRTYAKQGLSVELVTFRGDAGAAQALVGGSADISCQSLDGLVSILQQQQPVMAFFAGFDQADFAWYAKPSLPNWTSLKGKTVGITTYGSLTDQLTRYVLSKHGLDPDRDVRIIQAGPSPARLEAVKAGQLDATILSAPHSFMAEDAKLTKLGTQESEVSPQWPKHVFIAPKSFISDKPNTIEALLRGHIEAIQLAKADRNYAIDILTKTMKYERRDGEKAYDAAINGFDETGNFPEKSMALYWQITTQGQQDAKPIPEDQLLDRKFIDSRASWAPKAS